MLLNFTLVNCRRPEKKIKNSRPPVSVLAAIPNTLAWLTGSKPSPGLAKPRVSEKGGCVAVPKIS